MNKSYIHKAIELLVPANTWDAAAAGEIFSGAIWMDVDEMTLPEFIAEVEEHKKSPQLSEGFREMLDQFSALLLREQAA